MRLTRRHIAPLVVLLVGGPALAPCARAAAADDPPRVTGWSNLMDYMATGSKLAIPEVYGIGTSMANLGLAQFPAQAAPLTKQVFLAEGSGPQAFAATQPGAAQMIAAGRSGAAPFAAFNPQANGVLSAMSSSTRAGATALHPVLQPFDLTASQFADYLDSLQQK
ncbi:MAG TPA: hypothetical protein VHU88_07410 [Sporichthyaceae bacterium]|jgi:hypothetical protein|nr:hypothetical protein [Sporichthyaceae bacterium]